LPGRREGNGKVFLPGRREDGKVTVSYFLPGRG